MGIILILILGLILRLINLNQSLWLDEAVQAITSLGPLSNISNEMLGDFHPPLYHYFMWFYVHLFGSSEIILRLPSVIFGVTAIYAIYLISKEIISGDSHTNSQFPFDFVYTERSECAQGKHIPYSHIVAIFMATAPFHIYYSQEARPYALVTLLVLLSMLFFIKQNWKRYVLFSILMIYSSYYGLFILIVQGIFLILSKKYKSLIYPLISLMAFIFWFPMFLKQLDVGRQALIVLPQWGILVNASLLKALPLTFIKFILGRITIFDKTLYATISAGLFVIYGLLLAKGFLRKNILVNLWLVIPVIFSLLLSIIIPNFQPFRLLFVLPAFYILLVIGLISIKHSKITKLLIGVIVLVSALSLYQYYSNPYFWREDWRGLVSYVEAQNTKENPSVAIIPSSTSDWPWKYYSESKIKLINYSDSEKLAISRFRLTIYYVRYLQPVFDPNEEILSWLKQSGYNKVREVNFNQIPVWEYKK